MTIYSIISFLVYCHIYIHVYIALNSFLSFSHLALFTIYLVKLSNMVSLQYLGRANAQLFSDTYSCTILIQVLNLTVILNTNPVTTDMIYPYQVFLTEYAGPLVIYLLFYVRPSIIYGSKAAFEPIPQVVQ